MSTNNTDIVKMISKYLMSCDDEELSQLTVYQLARKFNMSQSYLYTVYPDKHARCTPGKSLELHKIMRAMILMNKGNGLTVKEIAKKMGFSTTDYFIRLFKKYAKCTPGQYMRYYRTRRSISDIKDDEFSL